jgi:transcription initiation factor TFIIB
MLQYKKKCPECGSTDLIIQRDKGEAVCRGCGLVIEEKMIDFGQEWREFDSDQASKRRRTGAPITPTKFDGGLATDIGQKKDIYQLSTKGKNKYLRLRKWQHRISTAIERNLKLALAELKRVSSYLKLPSAVEQEAATIYTRAVQKGLVRGRSMESVVAGSLYASCRRHEVPRTLDELSEASGIDKKEVGRTYRFITRELGIRILPSNPEDYLPRLPITCVAAGSTIASNLGLIF